MQKFLTIPGNQRRRRKKTQKKIEAGPFIWCPTAFKGAIDIREKITDIPIEGKKTAMGWLT